MSFSFSSLISMIIINAVFVLVLNQMIKTSMVNYFNIDLFLLASLAILIRFLLPFEFPFTISVPVKWGLSYLYDFFVMLEMNVYGYSFNIFTLFIFIWIAGILFYSICLFRQFTALKSCYQIARHKISLDSKATAILNEIALSYPQNKAVFTVYVTGANVSPFIYGIRHPVIILPNTIHSDEELYYILVHETTHYYNHHTLYKLLCSLLGVIYFWNPLVEIFLRELNRILEISVDAKVIAPLTPEGRLDYSRSLTSMAKTLAKDKASPSFAASFSQDKEIKISRHSKVFKSSKDPSSLSQRVQMIVNSPDKVKTLTPNGFVSALLLVAALTISLFFVFEPFRIREEDAQNTFDSTNRNLFYIANDDGTFSLYLDGQFMAVEDEISDSKLPVYDYFPNQ